MTPGVSERRDRSIAISPSPLSWPRIDTSSRTFNVLPLSGRSPGFRHSAGCRTPSDRPGLGVVRYGTILAVNGDTDSPSAQRLPARRRQPSSSRHRLVIEPSFSGHPGLPGLRPALSRLPETRRTRAMRRIAISIIAVVALAAVAAAPAAAARSFGRLYIDGDVYRTFGTPARVDPGTGTDPIYAFTNSTHPDQFSVARYAPGEGSHGGRWMVFTATWSNPADRGILVTDF